MVKKYNTLPIRRKPKAHAYNSDTNKLLLELPVVRNILSLLALRPNLQDLPISHLTDKSDFSIEHDCSFYSNSEYGLQFKIQLAMNGDERVEDFVIRSSCQLANFFNSLVIPVFLLATPKIQQKTPPPVLQEWQKLIKLTYKYDVSGICIQRATIPFVYETSETSDGTTLFFAVMGENIKQQLLNLERITENRIKNLKARVVIPNVLITSRTLEFAKYNVASLNSIALYSQLLPIYRSILAGALRDYGIASAPFKLGVGCMVMRDEVSQLKGQTNNMPTLKSCVFMHVEQACDFTIPVSFLQNSPPPIQMPTFSLFEVPETETAEKHAPTMLPYTCFTKKNVEYHQLLQKFLEARNIKVDVAPVTENMCTVLCIKPNPGTNTKKSHSFKSLAEYLHLLTSSCKTLLGNQHHIMAYAQTVQEVNGIPNVTLLHVLDIGTQPAKQNYTVISKSPSVFIYDEACHRASENIQTAIPKNTKEQIAQTVGALGKLFAKASRNPTDNSVKALYRSFTAKHSIDVQNFLETGKVQCIVVIQNAHVPAKTIFPVHETMRDAPQNKKIQDTQTRGTSSISDITTSPLHRPLFTLEDVTTPQVEQTVLAHSTLPQLSCTKEDASAPDPIAHVMDRHMNAPMSLDNEHLKADENTRPCPFKATNMQDTPHIVTAAASDTKSLHLDSESSTLLVINANQESPMPGLHPTSSLALEGKKRASFSDWVFEKRSTALVDACCISTAFTVIAIAIGIWYACSFRFKLDSMTRSNADLIAAMGLVSIVIVAITIGCAVMISESRAKKSFGCAEEQKKACSRATTTSEKRLSTPLLSDIGQHALPESQTENPDTQTETANQLIGQPPFSSNYGEQAAAPLTSTVRVTPVTSAEPLTASKAQDSLKPEAAFGVTTPRSTLEPADKHTGTTAKTPVQKPPASLITAPSTNGGLAVTTPSSAVSSA